jgi:2-(1,2-epoxy-1,2-dihydrophenyl)acetyl-CoA isomerase
VNGVAAGAGANIALAGDLVLAARSASFMQAFSKIALVPDCGGIPRSARSCARTTTWRPMPKR